MNHVTRYFGRILLALRPDLVDADGMDMGPGRRLLVASALLAAALLGAGPLAALAVPPDPPPCSGGDGNPDDGRGQDGRTCETTTTTTTASTTTTTTVATTTTTTTVAGGGIPPDAGTAPGTAVATAPDRGLKAMDMEAMAPSLAAAVSIVPKMGESSAGAVVLPETLSVRLDHLLGPAVPPALADAVVSPIVVLQALVVAMTSSSQSLLVPGVVLLLGLGLPGRRRRHPDRALIPAETPH